MAPSRRLGVDWGRPRERRGVAHTGSSFLATKGARRLRQTCVHQVTRPKPSNRAVANTALASRVPTADRRSGTQEYDVESSERVEHLVDISMEVIGILPRATVSTPLRFLGRHGMERAISVPAVGCGGSEVGAFVERMDFPTFPFESNSHRS